MDVIGYGQVLRLSRPCWRFLRRFRFVDVLLGYLVSAHILFSVGLEHVVTMFIYPIFNVPRYRNEDTIDCK